MSVNHNDILSDLGLVRTVKSLMEQRRNTPNLYARMKKAEKDHELHLLSIEATKAKLGRHVEARAGREEIVLIDGAGDALCAAHVRRVEVTPGVRETKVDFYTPRKL